MTYNARNYAPKQGPVARGQPRGCRPKISQPLRLWVAERDGFRCRLCHEKDPAARLGIYHDRSWRYGWPSMASNLVTLCRSCGAKRSGKVGEQPPITGVVWST